MAGKKAVMEELFNLVKKYGLDNIVYWLLMNEIGMAKYFSDVGKYRSAQLHHDFHMVLSDAYERISNILIDKELGKR